MGQLLVSRTEISGTIPNCERLFGKRDEEVSWPMGPASGTAEVHKWGVMPAIFPYLTLCLCRDPARSKTPS